MPLFKLFKVMPANVSARLRRQYNLRGGKKMRHFWKNALGLVMALTMFACLGACAWADVSWSGDVYFSTDETIYDDVQVNGNVTVHLSGSAKVVIEDFLSGSAGSSLTIEGNGTLHAIDGIHVPGIITVNSGKLGAGSQGETSDSVVCKQVIINGGSLSGYGGSGPYSTGLRADSVTVNGGSLYASSNADGIVAHSVVIAGGEVTAESGNEGIAGIDADSADISGGTVTVEGRIEADSITISGGQITIKDYGGAIYSPSVALSLANAADYIDLTVDSPDPASSIFNSEASVTISGSLKGDDGKIYSSANAADLKPLQHIRLTLLTGTFTVDYKPGEGKGDSYSYTGIAYGSEHTVDPCGFAAPEGKEFDCWQSSDGKTYKPGSKVSITSNLTLTALWKEEGSSSGEKTGTTTGDIVFIGGFESGSEEWYGGYVPPQAYRVILDPMQNGSAALGLLSGESTTTEMYVYPTTTVFVFPNPAPGYALDKIIWSLIDGSASYDITEAKNLVMPAMDVVVHVTFKPAG